MNLSFKIEKSNLITFGIFLIGLSSFNFYIYDPYYYPVILRIFVFLGLLILGVSIIPRKASLLFFLYFSFTIFYNYSGYFTHFFDQDLKSIYFSGLIFVISFVFLENIENKSTLSNSLRLIISFFIFINVISFIVFILFILKIPLPHKTINLGGRGFIYENYSNLLIVCNYVSYDFGSFILSRFNGVFEEPGMFGTYAGILLMVNIIMFPDNRRRRNILVILGIFSASLTFYFILVLVVLYYLSFKRIIMLGIITFIIIISVTSFLPQNSVEQIRTLTIDRFTFKDGQFTGNTRQTDNLRFARYVDKVSTPRLIFGNGKGKNIAETEASYSSVYSIIYESGIIGLMLFLLIHFYYLLFLPLKFNQYKVLILTIIPILSIYQGRQMIDFVTILYFLNFKYCFENNRVPVKLNQISSS